MASRCTNFAFWIEAAQLAHGNQVSPCQTRIQTTQVMEILGDLVEMVSTMEGQRAVLGMEVVQETAEAQGTAAGKVRVVVLAQKAVVADGHLFRSSSRRRNTRRQQ